MVRDGYYYGISLLVVAALLYFLTGSWLWPIVPVLLALFFLWFFRDPRRSIPQGEGLVVSPADGKVTSVLRVATPDGDSQRMSIFLNVFNVHVNRSPISGVLHEVRYQKGQYLNAMNPESAEKNEQNLAVVLADEGYTVAFKQIAGLLARRIVFRPTPGTRLQRGERIGLIKFGSRVDVILPGNAQILVKPGDHVQGGSTVLARIPQKDPLGQEDDLLVETLV
ncbi:phosphatidylserine decarboxylase [Silvibacterium bohemicum]|uniref:Phosphatidylserine decarboxylase proenzyme n=1 Tax=Silvibacterium bohemicum TaxID=1577686 RepID=A0A841JPF9_9BACT|nr:phosphatidylserine decarboxylase family protein [Silvibacterium bohemicum]MBB6143236.1 phosphatidylserine decarboxylase [Silvibacterium bohemicum]